MNKLYTEMNEDEKAEMWDNVADYLALPESDRVPQTNQELFQALCIPESTFYWKLQDEQFMKLVVRKSLTKAKQFIPEIIKILKQNAMDGKERSIEMAMEYIGDVSKKVDLTTGGNELNIKPEQYKSILERELKANINEPV